jgi:membrane associated rhomboid family serine protease
MRRYSSPYASGFSLGPGPLSNAMRALIAANVAMFIATAFFPELIASLGLVPYRTVERLQVWRLASYMFVHGGFFHIVFNMLALWMFGTELERTWGTRYFLKFYFVTGIGAAALTVVFSLLPFEIANDVYRSNVIGASGAIYALLLAYALYFPERPILLLVFWVPAKVCVAILGGFALIMSVTGPGGVAEATHVGGMLVGYLFLKSARIHPLSEIKYRYLKWQINRVRRKFDVYSGGRGANDWDRRVH